MSKRDREIEIYKKAVLKMCKEKGHKIKADSLKMKWEEDDYGYMNLRVYFKLALYEKPLSADNTIRISNDISDAIENIWEYDEFSKTVVTVHPDFTNGQQFKMLKKIA